MIGVNFTQPYFLRKYFYVTANCILTNFLCKSCFPPSGTTVWTLERKTAFPDELLKYKFQNNVMNLIRSVSFDKFIKSL